MNLFVLLLVLAVVGGIGTGYYLHSGTEYVYVRESTACTGNTTESKPIEGTSMLPTFRPGNILLLEEYTNQSLVEGDVVVYGDTHTTHRIKSAYPNHNQYYVCSDNFKQCEKTNKTQIKYVVCGAKYT